MATYKFTTTKTIGDIEDKQEFVFENNENKFEPEILTEVLMISSQAHHKNERDRL